MKIINYIKDWLEKHGITATSFVATGIGIVGGIVFVGFLLFLVMSTFFFGVMAMSLLSTALINAGFPGFAMTVCVILGLAMSIGIVLAIRYVALNIKWEKECK